MLNYSICKKLKEARYRQPYGTKLDGERYYYLQEGKLTVPFTALKTICYNNGYIIDYEQEAVYIPTLSELIEACGNNFERLFKVDSIKWGAGNSDFFMIGSAPEEAVANLYLKLHEKN